MRVVGVEPAWRIVRGSAPPTTPGSHVAISGTHEITSAPRKIASSAGSTDTATSRIGLANIAEAKKMFMPAGGHKKPISITARKITPKCTGSMP